MRFDLADPFSSVVFLGIWLGNRKRNDASWRAKEKGWDNGGCAPRRAAASGGYGVSSFGGSQRRHGITQGDWVSLSRHSVILPNGWIRGNSFIRVCALVLTQNRNWVQFFLLPLAFRKRLIFGSRIWIICYLNIVCVPPFRYQGIRIGCDLCNLCVWERGANRSARVHPHDDRSTRDTIRSREAMDGTTLLRDDR